MGYPLDTGTLRPDDELGLADELYLLAQRFRRRRIPWDVLAATLAAGALAELRLHARVRMEDADKACLYAVDTTPTGDLFLDGRCVRSTAPVRPTVGYRR